MVLLYICVVCISEGLEQASSVSGSGGKPQEREAKAGSRAKRTDVLWCHVSTVVTGKWAQTSLFPLQYQISLWEEGYLLPSFERLTLG